jgi:transcriptional regulator with XRE-family HTH domain
MPIRFKKGSPRQRHFVAEWRRHRQLSQAALGAELGISKASVSRIVRPKPDPRSGAHFFRAILDFTWRKPRRGRVGKVLSLVQLLAHFLGRTWSPDLVQADGSEYRRGSRERRGRQGIRV